jgi:hypothetical protein
MAIQRHLLVALLVQAIAAQTFCYHSGSTQVAASSTASPLPLGCTGAPNWPMWRMFTPQHRSPTAHFGYRPGRGESVPVIVAQYRCTGLLLTPVVASSHSYLGYVIDMSEHLCN